MSAELVTFGCRLNTNESEVMRGHAQRAGLDDAVIVNTCAVTGEAVRQARQTIRRIRRENPEKKILPYTFGAKAQRVMPHHSSSLMVCNGMTWRG